jgi:hypothetical protein
MRYRHSVEKFPDTTVGKSARRVVYLSAIAFPLAIVGR